MVGPKKKQQKEKKIIHSFPIFLKTQYWRPLVSNYKIVENPNNPYFESPCAPTVAKYEAQFVLVRHKFSERFSIPLLI